MSYWNSIIDENLSPVSSSKFPLLCIGNPKPKHSHFFEILNIFYTISCSYPLNALIFLPKSIRLYFSMIIYTIAWNKTILPFHEEFFNKPTSNIFVILDLWSILEDMVDYGFTYFLVKELEGFLYLWKLNIFVLDSVDKLTTFE